MRIVGGSWRGRPIAAPRGRGTRPTSDRVREAIFSVLDARFGGVVEASVLDLFAGSGALGLEALSRGAAHATFVEQHHAALRALERNIAALGCAGRAEVVRGDATDPPVERFSRKPFALLFADPPYRIEPAALFHTLERLAGSGALENGAVIVYEHHAARSARWPDGFEDAGDKRYGSTQVSFARWKESRVR